MHAERAVVSEGHGRPTDKLYYNLHVTPASVFIINVSVIYN